VMGLCELSVLSARKSKNGCFPQRRKDAKLIR
jgi:hypothetical protein